MEQSPNAALALSACRAPNLPLVLNGTHLAGVDDVVAGPRNTNVRLDELGAALADIKTLTNDLKTLTIESYNMAAYAYNSTSRTLSDTLKPLRNAAGNTPDNFPPTRDCLSNLNDIQLDQLGTFYGRQFQGESVGERRKEFEKFINRV